MTIVSAGQTLHVLAGQTSNTLVVESEGYNERFWMHRGSRLFFRLF